MAAAIFSLAISLPLLFLINPVYSDVLYIDCGASNGYRNLTTNSTWVGDAAYVRTGESHVVANPVGLSAELVTLRAFPKERKSCYTIPLTAKTRIQVKVEFYYGNYDGKRKPPSFRLMYDSVDWDKVETDMKINMASYIVYVTEWNYTNICLWRLSEDEVPFVTAIRIRSLESPVYSPFNSSVALYAPRRYAFGSDDTFSSPDDSYDRKWYPIDPTAVRISEYEVLRSRNNTTSVNTGATVNKPPARMFRTAIFPRGRSRNLTITTLFVTTPSQLYLNLYFTELLKLNTTDTRSFHVYVDDVLVSDAKDPIRPVFGRVFELSYIIPTATETTRITLAATADSTLPPIVSGFDALFTWPFQRQRTDGLDTETLSWLQGNFSVLQNWTGDPCLPSSYGWDWVRCSSDYSPRVTKLFLDRLGLSGEIPNFSALDVLVTIDMHHNNLSGPIPEFLGNFRNLRILNLAENDFSSIPSQLTNSTIVVNVTGNPKICEEGRTCIYGPYTIADAAPSPTNGSNNAMTTSLYLLLLILAICVLI